MHKEYCRKVKAAGTHTFDAILFAANETKPRIVKIPWKLFPGNEEERNPYQELDTEVWFKPPPHSDVRQLDFRRWGFFGPELGRGLCFLYDDDFLINGSPLNRCIVDATGGRATHRWSGNILGLRLKEFSHDFYANVDMEEDLKPFVTYFEGYNIPVEPWLSSILE